MLKFSAEKQSKLWGAILSHKVLAVIILLALVVSCVLIAGGNGEQPTGTGTNSSEIISSESATSSKSDESSSDAISSEKELISSAASVTPNSSKVTSSKAPTSSVTVPPITGTNYQYNTNIDIEDNVFLDSMIYTGYNIKKHRADGKMWVYILAAKKRGLGWLSDITYGAGSSGYETTKDGKPNIAHFERYGLVCASYVTYVYFNYLPNVAGIDTSSLTRPDNPGLAHSWYKAAKDWIKKGYSEEIKWKASLNSVGAINFKPEKEIPLGSIIIFQDDTKRPRVDHGSHVVVYAGYKNGYHWVYHVGNENGPEFCAVERMHYGPDPQWPLMVISTPSNIRMSAALEIEVKDETGAAVPGAKFTIKSQKTGKEVSMGTTNKDGKVVKDTLSYGDYKVTQTLPEGYTCDKPLTQLKLNTLNNSYNKITVTVTKKQAEVISSVAESQVAESKEAESTDSSVPVTE